MRSGVDYCGLFRLLRDRWREARKRLMEAQLTEVSRSPASRLSETRADSQTPHG